MTNAQVFAAANPLLVLLVLGVTLVFYIVQAVFKATMEPKKFQPPAKPARPPGATGPQPATSKAISSLEDYLKEARRKRALESGTNAGPEAAARPIPQTTTPPSRLEAFKPVLVPTQTAGPRGPKPSLPIPVAPRNAKKPKLPKPETTKPSIQIPAVANPLQARPATTLQQAGLSVPEPISLGQKASPLAQWIAGSLRDPKSIASALVLREILGPPVSTRTRRFDLSATKVRPIQLNNPQN